MATDDSRQLRGRAERVVGAALERVPLRAALLAGSAGRGDADEWSDVDLLLYVDERPGEETLHAVAHAVGAERIERLEEPKPFWIGADAWIDGARVEINFTTVERVEHDLTRMLDELEDVGAPFHKVLLGILEGQALYGEELIGRWQERLRAYPEPLRRAMIDRHWQFFPLWYYADWVGARDAELFRLDALLDGAFNVLGVLAGLNRLYFTRFHLKRTRAFIGQMERAPERLADRLESLFTLPPRDAAAVLGRLVGETRALVLAELPELELPLEEPLEERHRPWR